MTKMLVYFECEQDHFGAVMTAMASQMNNISELRIETMRDKNPVVNKNIQSEIEARVISDAKLAEDLMNVPRVNAGRVHPGDGRRTRKSIKDVNWENDKNSKVQALIKKTLEELAGSCDYETLKVTLEEHLFSANSLSPALTYMEHAGLVKRDRKNKRVELNLDQAKAC